MKIIIGRNQEVEIECYSAKDHKDYKAKVLADGYGRLSFKNLN